MIRRSNMIGLPPADELPRVITPGARRSLNALAHRLSALAASARAEAWSRVGAAEKTEKTASRNV